MLTRLNLRNRLLLSLILVASVSIVAATLFSIRYFSGKMYADASRNIQIKARVAESFFQHSLNDMQTLAQTLAIDSPLRLMLSYGFKEQISRYLSKRAYTSEATRIVVFDAQQAELARIVKDAGRRDFSHESFMADTLRTQHLNVSLRLIPQTHVPEPLLVMSAAMPIHNKKGLLIGAILVEHILNGDDKLLDEIETLLDVTVVIYAEGKAINFRRPPTIDPAVSHALISGKQSHYELREMRKGGELAEYIPLHDKDQTPVAILGIFQPADAYVQTRDEAIIKLLAIMLGCLLLASVLGFALARSFLEPIHLLSNGVRQISAGDLEYKIQLDSRDELGALAEAFNSMASQLHSSFGKIREQMQEIEQASEERERLVIQLQHQNKVLQREITERKHAEEDRQSLEMQVQQIHKLEALGTLAGGVAHDFNNILAIILLHSEMLLEDVKDDPAGKRALHQIIQAGERGAELVRQILAFSQVEEHERVAIGLGPIIQESLKMLRATIPATIVIQHDIQPDCPLILADATQIHQVIVNLSVNASQAMKGQYGVLEVNLKAVNYTPNQAALFALDEDVSMHVMLEIKDSGEGISPEIQERIFEPFFTTKSVGEGSGLGLSVVHGIVKSHHGEIEVQSSPGNGTSVRIFFPAITEFTRKRANQPPSDLFRPMQQGSAMVVDDEMDLLTLYTMQLTELGYLVTAVTNGDEALRQFRAEPHRFDLVLTDQSMPGLSGIELGKQMLEINPHLPIILITGFSETHIAEEARSKGIRHVLNKPLKMASLKHAIQKTMGENVG